MLCVYLNKSHRLGLQEFIFKRNKGSSWRVGKGRYKRGYWPPLEIV